jgi:DNA-binding LacI/PurR family transcriptional regulator
LPRSHVTIRDVAARAGVSHQTVSRVINNSERVNPDTRQRVEAAILALDYQPNAVARSMARGQTCNLACLAPNLTDFTFASIIEAAEIEARRRGFFLLSASAPDAEAFAELVNAFVGSRRAEALMVINPYADERHTFLPANVPLVFIGSRPRCTQAASVALDDEQAACQAAQHLLALGHSRIALITGPLPEDCVQERCQGFAQALQAAGLAPDPELVVQGDWSATSGYQAAQALLSRSKPFSAVVAQNDRMAVGAIQALRQAGCRVPQDVSVVGFDDMPLASYFDPPLTTMRQDLQSIGRTAAKLLIQAIETPLGMPAHVALPAELVIRQSTAPHPA